MILSSYLIASPLGDIMAIANSKELVLLEFSDSIELDYKKIKLENVY